MLVLADLGFLLDVSLELGVRVWEQPLEDGLLDFLVVFLLKEVIMQELDGAQDEELSFLSALVKRSDGSVGWKTDGPTGQDGHGGAVHVDGSAVWVDELKSTVLVLLGEVVLGVAISLGILALLLVALLLLAFCDSYQLFVQAAVADERLLRVKVLEEVLSDD